MGVPRLRHHLQPYADRATLNAGKAVIDGPALAYHVHNLCSTKAVKVPSCETLGQVCLRWLDEVADHGLSIEAIYFDGHLPAGKLPVRKDRLFRKTTDLRLLCRSNPSGCHASFLASHDTSGSRCYTSLPRRQHHALPQNPFTVQTIIDTLKLSSRYGAITRAVPGEADAFCAEAARSTQDAVILTSDSDLLIYDIGNSCVIFLDDIRLSDGDIPTLCFRFLPSSLRERLELTDTDSTSGIRRLAFELVKRPRASLLQLLDACGGVVDRSGYAEFSRNYDAQQSSASVQLGELEGSPLDARLLELTIQLNPHLLRLPCQLYSPSEDAARIFLPNLLENYGRSSCFDPSSEIRRIAYSLLPPKADVRGQVVWEFKRLHVTDGRGTPVPLCPLSELPAAARDLAAFLSHMASQTEGGGDYFWPSIALGLDARYSMSEGKTAVVSSLAKIARRVSEMTSVIPWDLVHFRAQVHACCYSFRLLGQVLPLVRTYIPSELVDTIYSLMQPYLSRAPPLAQLPATEHILGFLSPTPHDSPMARILRVLERQDLAPGAYSATAGSGDARKDERSGPRARQSFDSGNPFGILLNVED